VTGTVRSNPGDDRLLVRAAYLYYRLDLTQAQVADRLGLSRVKVGRLLASALERRIVTIDIRHPLTRLAEMEVDLERRFGLRDVVVASSAALAGEDDLQLLAVAQAGADYLTSLELRHTAVALGWGTTMRAVSAALDDGWADDIDVFQLNGAIPMSNYATGAGEIMNRFAERGHGRAHLLQVPGIVDRTEVRHALETERSVSRVLAGAREAPVAAFSLGNLTAESVLVSSGYLDSESLGALRASGAVGDIISRFIGADGALSDMCLDERTMGVELATLRAQAGRERVIGIAAGPAKAPIARAAMAGGYIDTLIVDDSLALALLSG
jgi:deoxyribonucleoside regulator